MWIKSEVSDSRRGRMEIIWFIKCHTERLCTSKCVPANRNHHWCSDCGHTSGAGYHLGCFLGPFKCATGPSASAWEGKPPERSSRHLTVSVTSALYFLWRAPGEASCLHPMKISVLFSKPAMGSRRESPAAPEVLGERGAQESQGESKEPEAVALLGQRCCLLTEMFRMGIYGSTAFHLQQELPQLNSSNHRIMKS